ncbi:ribose ABC transporter permease (plasmid) [Paraburkholderia terrae]|uniref:Ribose ABC transporter permease n=2 Tax=Paraburkholderia terrae TaxID=311230 RepID=A0ABM7UC63_9BURK|nr:ribose ABC transporter permease [Paraburkholderia terrae]BDC45945.1 ribose ABC transporter permease [Paraburkholderia terrae]
MLLAEAQGQPLAALRLLGGNAGIYVALLLLCLVMSVGAPNFLTLENLLDVSRQISITAILAAGLTFVILSGGIDLSVGSALGMTTYASIALAAQHGSLASCLLGALVVGLGIGLLNGALVAYARLTPFIVTLAALTYLRGLVYVGTDGRSLFAAEIPFGSLGQGDFLGVPNPVFVLVAIYALGWFLLERTVYGRHVFAVGGNVEAARLAGLPVPVIILSVYAISGLCAAFAGILAGARLQTAVPTLGVGYELNAIAAVVLGGTSLAGGRGSLTGTLAGVAIIGLLANGLTLMNVPSFYQLVIQGVVIVLAIGIDKLRRTPTRAGQG